MHTTTVGVDLAKSHIQVAVADPHYRVVQRLRLSRSRFEAFAANHRRSLFVLEACGSSQPWGRKLQALGKTVDQQQILLLHRLREQYKQRRTARINLLRGCLREMGIAIPTFEPCWCMARDRRSKPLIEPSARANGSTHFVSGPHGRAAPRQK